MVSRSIVGRFLILAVLLVSLGVIAQAGIIISQGSGKRTAKGDPVLAPSLAVLASTPARAGTIAAAPSAVAATSAASQPEAGTLGAEAAPVRVVYPGPLGDAPAQPRKITDAAPASPLPAAAAPLQSAALQPGVPVVAPQPASIAAPARPSPAVAAAAPPKPSPVVVAAADADTQPTAVDPASATHGVDLNSASVDALNHVGGGHIGQMIVKHRPYGSVEDLVKKRVVRRSVYEQIKNQVAAE